MDVPSRFKIFTLLIFALVAKMSFIGVVLWQTRPLTVEGILRMNVPAGSLVRFQKGELYQVIGVTPCGIDSQIDLHTDPDRASRMAHDFFKKARSRFVNGKGSKLGRIMVGTDLCDVTYFPQNNFHGLAIAFFPKRYILLLYSGDIEGAREFRKLLNSIKFVAKEAAPNGIPR